MKYYAFVYGIYFYGDTHKEVQYTVEDYVQDVLSGPIERYTIREWKLSNQENKWTNFQTTTSQDC